MTLIFVLSKMFLNSTTKRHCKAIFNSYIIWSKDSTWAAYEQAKNFLVFAKIFGCKVRNLLVLVPVADNYTDTEF